MSKLKFIRKYLPIILGIIYLISPIDFIPDFLIALIGPFVVVDDVIVIVVSSLVNYYLEQRKQKHLANKTIYPGEEI